MYLPLCVLSQQLRHGGIPPSPRNLSQILPRSAATPRSARLSASSAAAGRAATGPVGAAPKLPKVGSAGSLASVSASSPPTLASMGSSEGTHDELQSPKPADLVAHPYAGTAAGGRADRDASGLGRDYKSSRAPAIQALRLPGPGRQAKPSSSSATGSMKRGGDGAGNSTHEAAEGGRTRLQRRRPAGLTISDSDRCARKLRAAAYCQTWSTQGSFHVYSQRCSGTSTVCLHA